MLRLLLSRNLRVLTAFPRLKPFNPIPLNAMTSVFRTMSTSSNSQRMEFKAETKKLLDIVAKSIYTESEVFLRELLSNCSDALEKQKFKELKGEAPNSTEPLHISLTTNEKERILTIFVSNCFTLGFWYRNDKRRANRKSRNHCLFWLF